jgi:hypothetical protein
MIKLLEWEQWKDNNILTVEKLSNSHVRAHAFFERDVIKRDKLLKTLESNVYMQDKDCIVIEVKEDEIYFAYGYEQGEISLCVGRVPKCSVFAKFIDSKSGINNYMIHCLVDVNQGLMDHITTLYGEGESEVSALYKFVKENNLQLYKKIFLDVNLETYVDDKALACTAFKKDITVDFLKELAKILSIERDSVFNNLGENSEGRTFSEIVDKIIFENDNKFTLVEKICLLKVFKYGSNKFNKELTTATKYNIF